MSPDCSCIFTWQIWEWLIFSSQQESKSAYFPERQTIPFNIWSRLRINQFTICLFLDRSVQCVTLSCGPCDEYDLLFLWNSMLCCVYMAHFQQSLDLSVCPSDFQRVQEELRSPKDRELKQPNLVNICPFFFFEHELIWELKACLKMNFSCRIISSQFYLSSTSVPKLTLMKYLHANMMNSSSKRYKQIGRVQI